MRKSLIIGLSCIAMIGLVACGNKKVNTGEVEVNKDHYEIVKPVYIAPEKDDGYITVLESVFCTGDDGKQKIWKQYTYDDEGKVDQYIYYDAPGDGEHVTSFQYNEYGYPCGYIESGNEDYSSTRVVDSAGYVVVGIKSYEYKYNSEGRFESVVNHINNDKMDFVYEDGNLVRVSEKIDSLSITYEYKYDAGKLVSRSYVNEGDDATENIVYNYDGDAYTYESSVVNSDGSVRFNRETKVDDKGMPTFYNNKKYNGEEIVIEGKYNDNNALFTMMSNREGSEVRGYQIQLSEDGRPVEVYKVDSENKKLSDKPFCVYDYDDNGHLLSIIFTEYQGGKLEDSRNSETTCYVFKRVPKDTYKESYFFRYENILKPTEVLESLVLYLKEEI